MTRSSDVTGRSEVEPRELVIRPMRIDDDAREFNSGNRLRDTWLRASAWQSRKRWTAATQVLVPADETGIRGYYVLAARHIENLPLPKRLGRRHRA